MLKNMRSKEQSTMKIEEILKNAGIEDETIIEKVKAEMPKSFMPLEDANKRIGAAKKATDDLQASFDAYKAEVEQAQQQAAANGDESAKKLADLQAKYEALQGDFTASQNAIKERDAKEALTKALEKAGANPAALELLATSALASVEFGEDGKPSNIDAVAEQIKTDNAGLFGEQIDTGQQQGKADEANDLANAFDEGFGDTERH